MQIKFSASCPCSPCAVKGKSQPVLLYLFVQMRSVYAEQGGGGGLVVARGGKSADNGVFFRRVHDTHEGGAHSASRRLFARSQKKRDIVRLDGVPFQKAGHTAEHIDQFSDIAGPVVVQQYRFRCRVNLYFREGGVLGYARKQGFRYDSDVVPPFSERRDMETYDVETVKKILPESAVAHPLLDGVIARGEKPEIRFHRGNPADALQLFFFQHAQDLGLHFIRHVADLVEEHGAFVGEFEFTVLAR